MRSLLDCVHIPRPLSYVSLELLCCFPRCFLDVLAVVFLDVLLVSLTENNRLYEFYLCWNTLHFFVRKKSLNLVILLENLKIKDR